MRSAWSAVSQRPSLVIPIGTTSYLLLSIALRTDAADSNDTSCSPLRPPNRMPTRNFFMTDQSGRANFIRQSQGWFGRVRKCGELSPLRLLAHLLPPPPCHSLLSSSNLLLPALHLWPASQVIDMQSNRFSRPFADVWQYLPFEPSAALRHFLDRFMIAGRFDAERFWEFVATVSQGQTLSTGG